MISWKAYPINPIDFGCDTLPTVEETAARIARTHAQRVLGGYEPRQGTSDPVNEFLMGYKDALELVGDRGLGADMTEEARVFWLPMENDFGYAFVWKKENTGETFIVSPEQLPWLDEHVQG